MQGRLVGADRRRVSAIVACRYRRRDAGDSGVALTAEIASALVPGAKPGRVCRVDVVSRLGGTHKQDGGGAGGTSGLGELLEQELRAHVGEARERTLHGD